MCHSGGGFVSTDLHLQPPVRRPSGLLDSERKELYVLNLGGQLAGQVQPQWPVGRRVGRVHHLINVLINFS